MLWMPDVVDVEAKRSVFMPARMADVGGEPLDGEKPLDGFKLRIRESKRC